jgi:hypothetical protein
MVVPIRQQTATENTIVTDEGFNAGVSAVEKHISPVGYGE